MRSRSSRPSVLAALLLTSLAVGGCSGSTDRAEGATSGLSLGVGIAASSAAVALGVDEKFFDEEGLAVELTPTQSPPSRVAAVQSGALDIVELPTPAFIGARAKGIDLRVVAAQYGYPTDVEDTAPYQGIDLMVGASSKAQRARDLEGARVAVPSREDLMEILVTNAVADDGGDPSTIRWVVLDFTSQVTALKADRVDAAVVPMPFNLRAREAGARVIAHPAGDFFGSAPTTVWVAGAKVSEDSKLIERVQRAIYRSNSFGNDHHDEVTTKAAELTSIPAQAFAAAQARYHFPTSVDTDQLQQTADRMFELGFLPTRVDIAKAVLDDSTNQS